MLQFRTNDSVDERIINLEANSYVRIRSANVPRNVAFAVVQAHSQIHTISMAQDRKFVVGNHVNGTSIGIVVESRSTNSAVMAYLINTLPINITVLTFILYYDGMGKSTCFPSMEIFLFVMHESLIFCISLCFSSNPRWM